MTQPYLRAALLVVAVGLFACASERAGEGTSAGAADFAAAAAPGELVVDFEDGTTKAQFDAWEKDWGVDLEFNSTEDTQDGITVAVRVADVAAAVARIKGSGNRAIEAVEPNYLYSVPTERLTEAPEAQVGADGFPNDPDFPKQWNLKLIGASGAWAKSRGKGVVVAVLDTGIAYQNKGEFIQVPDLEGAKFARGYDFVNDREEAFDDHGHGTHVAGTIAQRTHNGRGVAGVAFEATLMPVKVLDHFGRGKTSDIADAIRWAADHGASVINMSLGGGMPSAVMGSAVKYARSKGVTVVCAAGNTGSGHVQYPAAYEGAVAVSAIGPDGKLAPYSSWGKQLDLAAPGGNKQQGEQSGILQNTIDPTDISRPIYAYYQGTSMAAPHVAGVAALLYAAGARTPDEVEAALFKGVKKAEGQAEWNERYGHGVLDAQGALAQVGGRWGVNWKPLLAALLLLVVVLLTLGRRQRPGYFNILLQPAFLAPLVLATVGLFVARLFGGPQGSDTLDALSLPLPDLDRIIFGRGKLANPLFYSALIPLVASVVAIKAKSLRPLIAGLSLGFGGFLAYAAYARAPALAWMPFTFLAVPWLVVNVLVCLLITRAMLKKDVPA